MISITAVEQTLNLVCSRPLLLVARTRVLYNALTVAIRFSKSRSEEDEIWDNDETDRGPEERT